MAVIKAGRTRMLKFGIIGATIALVPMLIICGILVFFIAKKDTKIQEAYVELEKYKEGTVCVIDSDLSKGQEIRPENIKVIKGRFYEKQSFGEPADFVGKVLKTDICKGMMLSESVVAKKSQYQDDVRAYFIDYISIPDGFKDSTSFDIRISFPNGEDYLVAANKKISDRDEEGFYINLTRKEALLLSSAKVDVTVYSGTKLYVAFYTLGFEAEYAETYPVNDYVFGLGQWETDIKDSFSQEMFERRKTLESNLFDFMGIANNLQ